MRLKRAPILDPTVPCYLLTCGMCGFDHPAVNPAWIRAQRKADGLTLAQLAELAHLSPNTISAVESGRASLSRAASLAVLAALRGDLTWLDPDPPQR